MQWVDVATYNADGNLTQEEDALGNTTSYTYNNLGQPAQQPDPSNSAIELGPVYDKAGNVASNTDLLGNVTSYSYNSSDQVTQVFSPFASAQAPLLIPGPLPDQLSPTSAWTTQSGGPYGSYSTTTSTSATATYSLNGLVPGEQYELLATWPFTYSQVNTLSAIYTVTGVPQAVSASADQQNYPSDYFAGIPVPCQDILTFTAGSGTVTITIQNGQETAAVTAGELLILPTRAPASATYTYNADGDMTSQTDALGNVTAYGFDAFGNQVSESLPDPSTGTAGGPTTTTTYAFDLDGNEVSTTDPMSNVTAYSYDAFGNQISQSLPNPTTGKQDGGQLTTSYTFDAMGDMLSLTDPDGNTTSWTYDGLGDKTSESEQVSLGYLPGTDTLQAPITATSTYQYDLDGNLTESADANANAPAGYGFTGEVNTYSYNATNQQTGESWYTNTADAYAGSSSVGSSAYSYDAEGRMLTAANSADSTQIASYTYGYDAVGNVTSDNVQLGDLPGSDNVLLTSSYDFNGDRTSLSANIGGTLVDGGRGRRHFRLHQYVRVR